MGIVGFQWDNHQLTLLMNRDNWETRVIKEVDWVGSILRARCEKTNGTWFAFKDGRVAFLVDQALMVNMIDKNRCCSEILPIDFLVNDLSPEMFAAQLVDEEKQFHLVFNEEDKEDEDEDDWMSGRAYNLIVADIISGSMVYIFKPTEVDSLVKTERVAFGVHTLSLQGLDSNSPKDLRLRNLFNEMIGQYKNKELPPLTELTENFMYDTTEIVPGDKLSTLFVNKKDKLPSSERDEERYGTTSTTAFVVDKDNTNQAMLYERYLEDGLWNENDFTFNAT